MEALCRRARVRLVSSMTVEDPLVREAVDSLVELGLSDPPMRPLPVALRRVRDVWLATLSRQPREVADLSVVRRALVPYAETAAESVVIVEYAALADLPPSSREQPRMLTLHNIGSVMAEQEAAIDPVWRRRWLSRREAGNWRRWAARVLPSYDTVITVSAHDAETLPPGPTVLLIPNGVDTDRYRPAPLPDGPRLIFTGALYTRPNREGLAWFCTEVLPLIRRRHPEVVLTVAGLRPGPDVLGLASAAGIELMPDVPDVLPLLHDARVAVVPIRIGSGSRLKVLEAMAAGRPVVSTSIGAEGLQVEPGRHLLVADSPDEFAAAVSQLILDGAAAGKLARAGRELVEEVYAWPRIASKFVDAVMALAQAGHRQPGRASGAGPV